MRRSGQRRWRCYLLALSLLLLLTRMLCDKEIARRRMTQSTQNFTFYILGPDLTRYQPEWESLLEIHAHACLALIVDGR